LGVDRLEDEQRVDRSEIEAAPASYKQTKAYFKRTPGRARAEGEKQIMPARPSHLPHNLERTTLQKMSATRGLSSAQLHPAGRRTIAGMIAKGWIEKRIDARGSATYCVTSAGKAALKAKIPDRGH
jgi:hypothetical protein